jgi:hypothetical protein
VISIPGGQIHSEENSLTFAGLAQFFHDVAFAVLPLAVLDAVLGELARPEAEAVVMFAGQNQPLQPARFECGNNLIRIKAKFVRSGLPRLN